MKKNTENTLKRIIRKDGDEIVFADKVAMDKERVGQIVIAAAAVGVMAAATVQECRRNSSEDGVGHNIAAVGGLMAAGAIAGIGIAALEGVRMDRKENEKKLGHDDTWGSAPDDIVVLPDTDTAVDIPDGEIDGINLDDPVNLD